MIPAKTKIVSTVLKCVIILSVSVGTILSAVAGRAAFMGGGTVFLYFTIQSNVAVALISLAGLFFLWRKGKVPLAWQVVKYVGAVAITLTGTVFCFMLAPTMGALAWNVQNVLTHVVVPMTAVADFLLTGAYGNIRYRNVVFVLVPPLAYVIFAGVGYVRGWNFGSGRNYPYFFLNWGSPAGAVGFTDELPFLGCVWWILILMVGLLLVGLLYLVLLRALRTRTRKPE